MVRQIRVSFTKIMACATYQEAKALIEGNLQPGEKVISTCKDYDCDDFVVLIKVPLLVGEESPA